MAEPIRTPEGQPGSAGLRGIGNSRTSWQRASACGSRSGGDGLAATSSSTATSAPASTASTSTTAASTARDGATAAAGLGADVDSDAAFQAGVGQINDRQRLAALGVQRHRE